MFSIPARVLARSASLTTPFVRVAARPAIPVSVLRSFTASSITNKGDNFDIIQELYVKELKGYKPPPGTKGAEAGQVKDLKLPAAPSAPNVKEDLSADLQAYATEEVGEEHEIIEDNLEEEELEEKDAKSAH